MPLLLEHEHGQAVPGPNLLEQEAVANIPDWR
jgi:hypothetical protein